MSARNYFCQASKVLNPWLGAHWRTECGLHWMCGEVALEGKICLNLLLLWNWRQRVALSSPNVHSWGVGKWSNGQDGGPLGKGSSINTPRVRFVSVCAGLSTWYTAQPVPLIWDPAKSGLANTRRISIGSFLENNLPRGVTSHESNISSKIEKF